MLNQQKPEPADHTSGTSLDIIEIFRTLQGEGPFSGRSSIFVRLAGCNLQCPTCDTIYVEGRHRMEIGSITDEIVRLVREVEGCDLVVITGGEPTRQNIEPLIRRLINDLAFTVQIESNGVLALPQGLRAFIETRSLHYIVSPKTARISPAASCATAFKYVLSHDDLLEADGLPIKALGHKANPYVARPPKGWTGPIYVNPCDDKDEVRNRLNMLAARDSAMRFGYVLGLQIHKILDIP